MYNVYNGVSFLAEEREKERKKKMKQETTKQTNEYYFPLSKIHIDLQLTCATTVFHSQRAYESEILPHTTQQQQQPQQNQINANAHVFFFVVVNIEALALFHTLCMLLTHIESVLLEQHKQTLCVVFIHLQINPREHQFVCMR